MSVNPVVIARINELTVDDFGRSLSHGLSVRIGPFNAKIYSEFGHLVEPLYALYRDYEVLADNQVLDIHVKLEERRNFPRLHKRMVRFSVDGRIPHEDMPAAHALPVLEWGLNLVIALRSHCYLMLHSAVVEYGGRAMLLPAAPGDGKTTLCTGLCLRGWRLLSDEFGLIRPGDDELIPVPRPMALKNESIDIIREFDSNAVIGPSTTDTRKGTVAHVKPPMSSVVKSDLTAPARWIVFPRWRPGVASTLQEVSTAEGFMHVASNAFNYELLGEAAFNTVGGIVGQSRCFKFEYSDLEDATAVLTEFAKSDVD